MTVSLDMPPPSHIVCRPLRPPRCSPPHHDVDAKRPIVPAAVCAAAAGDAGKNCPPAGGLALLPSQRPTAGRQVLKENTMQRIQPGSPTTGRPAVSDPSVSAAADTPAPTMPSAAPRTATAARWRRILPAALCAAALSAALIVPAIASAEPYWDIGQFDQCMQGAEDNPDEDYDVAYVRCCSESGGLISEEQNACVTPPCDCPDAVRPGHVRPGLTPSPGVTLQPATPVPTTPPPGVMPTLTAVPGTRG